MIMTKGRIALAALAALTVTACKASNAEVDRGRYLVVLMGCGDCHTPGGFSPSPDTARIMAGSDTSIAVPGLGVFSPPNLTPDKETGLGKWTDEQVIKAITTGVRPDGRVLAPAMPWTDFSHLTKEDAGAVVAYLRSLPPVSNKVPGPGPAKPEANVVMTFFKRP